MCSLIHQTPGPDSDSMHQMSIIDDTTAGNQHLKFPPGLRFQPDDDVLVVNFLQPKILEQPLPPVPDIPVINLYNHNPNDLSEDYPALKNESVFYILTPRDRKYPKGKRPNRAAKGGYWKATGADKEIFHREERMLVGFKKTLVFYQGKPPGGQKTNWIMHEYRAKDACHVQKGDKDMKLDDWVLCRLFRKKPAGDKTNPVRDSLDEWGNQIEYGDDTTYNPTPLDVVLDADVADGDLDDVFEEIYNHFKVLECPDQPVPSDFMGNQIRPDHGNSIINATSQGKYADLERLMSSDLTWDEMEKVTSGCAEGGGYEVQMEAAGTNLTSAQVLPTHINHMSTTPKEAEAHHWRSDNYHYGSGVQMVPAGDIINLTSTQALQMDTANTNYMSTPKEGEAQHWRSDNHHYGSGVQMVPAGDIINLTSTQALQMDPANTNYMSTPKEAEAHHWRSDNHHYGSGVQMVPAGDINLTSTQALQMDVDPANTNYMSTRKEAGPHQWMRVEAADNCGVQMASAYNNYYACTGQEGTRRSGNVNVSRGVPPYTNHIRPGQEGTHWSDGNGTQWSRGAGSSGDGVQVAPAAYSSNCMSVGDEKGTQWSSCGIDDGHQRKKRRLDNDLVANVGPSVPRQVCSCSLRHS